MASAVAGVFGYFVLPRTPRIALFCSLASQAALVTAIIHLEARSTSVV
jgi:hypothetical protein